MPTFIDYARDSDLNIIAIAVREASTLEHDYQEPSLEDSIEHFLTPGHIVVFDRPIVHVERLFKPFSEYFENRPLRARWFDVLRFLRRETGLDAALSKVADATLGPGPQSTIADLPALWSESPTVELFNKMHDRLKVLMQIYLQAEFTGEIRFNYKTEQIVVEVDILEPALP